MRNPPVMLLLLLVLGPAAWAAPRAGTNRPEPPVVTTVDPHPDPLSPETPALLLLWSAVQSLGPPEQDVQAMTRQQALLYLFVLHDHDQSRRLDGLELLQLLGTVLAQAGGQPDPDTVAALVDKALARQDLNGDGLLDPSELLDPPEAPLSGQDRGPPGEPPLEQQAGLGAVPGEGTEVPRQDLGLKSPGQAVPEAGEPQTGVSEDGEPQTGVSEDGEPQTGVSEDGASQTGAPEAGEPQDGAPEAGAPKLESLEVESPNAEAVEAEVVPGAQAPSSDAPEEEEAPEAEGPEDEQAAPAWRDHGEG
ncbi:cell growth regulator with EF hand domain protein 1 [Ammospiza caudacuta]|uniref:cell growth regulator with EF hand domain protein 1 n=1 Tax=Ammospiza caudacuta TaxID=2857398 RepID=UPI0027393C70|nr:cell growth regulator with EF hand domain protein 1 [Ammospiza caudacuta]